MHDAVRSRLRKVDLVQARPASVVLPEAVRPSMATRNLPPAIGTDRATVNGYIGQAAAWQEALDLANEAVMAGHRVEVYLWDGPESRCVFSGDPPDVPAGRSP